MRKTITKPITITQKDWEEAKKLSEELFGSENFSGYVSYLIRKEINTKLNK